MRGSLKTQISAVLACCTAIGASRHEYKQLYGGRSPFIHSLGTLDKAVHRLWPLQEWLKDQGIYDLESIDNNSISRYIEHRLNHHLQAENSRKTYQTELSALGNLERGLNMFSMAKRAKPKQYDFKDARKRGALLAKKLPFTTGTYVNRAPSRPEALILALKQPHHQLMARLQMACGCRAEGVGAPRRRPPSGNRLTLENFTNEHGQHVEIMPDPITGEPVYPFWTQEKGGKIATKFCPIELAETLFAWFETHPEGLGDDYEIYLRAINAAMKATGQYVKGKGTHALRFVFAQRRYLQCVLPIHGKGMGDEEAKLWVSREMGHNRPDITESYCR